MAFNRLLYCKSNLSPDVHSTNLQMVVDYYRRKLIYYLKFNRSLRLNTPDDYSAYNNRSSYRAIITSHVLITKIKNK